MRNKLISSLAGAVFSFAASGLALAADMAVKAPPPAPAPVFSWTGFFIGGNIGGGWGHRDVTFTANDPAATTFFFVAPPPAPSFNVDGVVGGVQFGYNWQFQSNWLLGFETDFDGSGMKGSSVTADLKQTGTYFVDEHIKWFGTVRGRLGWLPSQNLLIYGTGGFAYGEVEHSGNWTFAIPAGIGSGFGAGTGGFSFNCGNIAGGANPCFAGSSRSIETGWTAGGGLEWALSPHWSIKGEYLFVSLASKSLRETALASCCGEPAPASFNANFSRTNFNIVRVGLNYQFH